MGSSIGGQVTFVVDPQEKYELSVRYGNCDASKFLHVSTFKILVRSFKVTSFCSVL